MRECPCARVCCECALCGHARARCFVTSTHGGASLMCFWVGCVRARRRMGKLAAKHRKLSIASAVMVRCVPLCQPFVVVHVTPRSQIQRFRRAVRKRRRMVKRATRQYLEERAAAKAVEEKIMCVSSRAGCCSLVSVGVRWCSLVLLVGVCCCGRQWRWLMK